MFGNWYPEQKKKKGRRAVPKFRDGFLNKELSVSLDVVEKKIEKIREDYEEEIKGWKTLYFDTINEIKKFHAPKGVAILGAGHRDVEYLIGYPTGYNLDGFELYTGDEIVLNGGMLGIVAYHGGTLSVVTNYEIAELKREYDEYMEVNRHMYTYQNGEEVGKGRKGCAGFTIKLEGAN